MTGMVKRVAERLLSRLAGRPGRMAGHSLILAYHNVVPDDLPPAGDRSLHLPLGSFREQLDLLEAHCDVCPLADLLESPARGLRPRVAITFDDAYRGAVELAIPELHRRGLPSTLFVAPGLLGAGSFWWDELADGAGLSGDLRRKALEELAGQAPQIRAGRTFPALPVWHGGATEEQVGSLASLESVTFGAHSWDHPNLTRVDADLLTLELSRPLEWLRRFPDRALPVLAYPYGLTSRAVEEAAKDAGYGHAVLIEGGWFQTAVRATAVPRLNIPAGLSRDGFLLRLSGRRRT